MVHWDWGKDLRESVARQIYTFPKKSIVFIKDEKNWEKFSPGMQAWLSQEKSDREKFHSNKQEGKRDTRVCVYIYI